MPDEFDFDRIFADSEDDAPSTAPPSRCNGCGKSAGQLDEYVQLADDEGYDSAEDAVRLEEGTYNTQNGHYWCSPCYIAAGQPLGIAA